MANLTIAQLVQCVTASTWNASTHNYIFGYIFGGNHEYVAVGSAEFVPLSIIQIQKRNAVDENVEGTLQEQQYCISISTDVGHFSRFDGFTVSRRNRYYGSRVLYYSNSHASFQLLCLAISRDINPNPGPQLTGKKSLCTICDKTLARNHKTIECTNCYSKFHVKCGKISLKYYTRINNGENGYVRLACNCLISNDCLGAGIDYDEACTNEFAETDVVRIQEIAKKYIKNCKIDHI